MYAFDPELVPWLSMIPVLDRTDPVGARRAVAQMTANVAPYASAVPLTITDIQVPGPASAPDVPVRIFRPRDADAPLPVVLWIHGGGFTLGSVDLDANGAAQVAAECGALVASVEYRLAPENPYPAGLEDCYAVLCWVAANAARLGGDGERLVVSGESAGGGLAAAVSLLARDRRGPAVRHQFLFVPELDDRLDTPSMLAYTDTPVWHRDNAILSWTQYLGELAGTDDVPAYAAPGRCKDLSGLPSACVVVCEFDPLRDEGLAYAAALAQAGVSVELRLYPGTFHGSTLIGTAAISQRMTRDKLDTFRRVLSRV
jgi:acetyl esterase